ncbi:hypothetical protein LB503_001272 [Fusarium chuoi]|nr:hypothetical protein LB503_001272 [Fusarium chuoi]
MARSSSPLPIRHSNALPRTPSLARNTITIDDADEITDTIPCSPSTFFRDRDTTTQPTQVLQKPGLAPMRSSSPASSIVEQPKKPTPLGNTLGSRVAPLGTFFRPPQRPPPAMTNKRPAVEPINLISDDEDDLTPPRGDIRPTTFKAQISAFASEKTIKTKLRQIYDVFGEGVPSHKAKEALSACKNDLTEAIDYLELQMRQSKQPASNPKPGRRGSPILSSSEPGQLPLTHSIPQPCEETPTAISTRSPKDLDPFVSGIPVISPRPCLKRRSTNY